MKRRRTALVTGAGGFCARHLATRLAGEGNEVVVGVGLEPQPRHSAGLAEYLQCDVSRYTDVARVVREVRPDRVFHLAGTSGGTRQRVFATNARGTANLLRAVHAERPTAAVVVMGSAAEYGNVPRRRLPITEAYECHPRTPYGLSKLAATRSAIWYSRARRLRVVVARPFNMIGPYMPRSLVLGAVVDQIRRAISEFRRPAVVMVGRTDTRRDFVLVDDVCGALVRMIEAEPWGEVFNLCSGAATPVRALLRAVRNSVQWPIRFRRDSALCSRPGPLEVYGSYAKAEAAFGFVPTADLDRAVRRICRLELRRPAARRDSET